MNWILIFAPFLAIGAVLFFGPNMMQRGFLFGVPVPADFRSAPEGRRAIAFFRTAIVTAIAIGIAILAIYRSEVVSECAPLLLLAVGAAAFFRVRQTLLPYAVATGGIRSMELSAEPEKLPRAFWLGLMPFPMLAAAAVFLRYHWSQIPDRFPVHWGFNGDADHWAEKTVKGVYGPLLFAAGLCVWFMAMALAAWYGARRSSVRPDVLKTLIAAECCIAVTTAAFALEPVLRLPAPLIGISAVCLAIPLIAFAIKKSIAPAATEVTPANCWKGGILYYNPNDAVLFVQKRIGFGYTVNFANPWSWCFLGGLLAVAAATPALLP